MAPRKKTTKKGTYVKRGTGGRLVSSGGMEYPKTVGTKQQVMNGTAKRTAGGLTKKDIKVKTVGKGKNASRRYVSKAKSQASKGNPAIKAWRKAVIDANKDAGNTKKNYNYFPKKGSALHRSAKKYFKDAYY